MRPPYHDEENDLWAGQWTREDTAKLWEEITKDPAIRRREWEEAFEVCMDGAPELRKPSRYKVDRDAREQATHKERGGFSCQVLADLLTGDWPNARFVVGWDRTLKTYFCQVWRSTCRENLYHCVDTIGTCTGEVPSLDRLQRLAGIKFPEATLAELRIPSRVTPIRVQALAAPAGDPDEWLRDEFRRADLGIRSLKTGRDLSEDDLRPLQSHHPKLSREL